MSKKDYNAENIWATLQANYPEEIRQIHQMQKKDMDLYGKIQPSTEKLMNDFMDQVVEDNKLRRGEN